VGDRLRSLTLFMIFVSITVLVQVLVMLFIVFESCLPLSMCNVGKWKCILSNNYWATLQSIRQQSIKCLPILVTLRNLSQFIIHVILILSDLDLITTKDPKCFILSLLLSSLDLQLLYSYRHVTSF